MAGMILLCFRQAEVSTFRFRNLAWMDDKLTKWWLIASRKWDKYEAAKLVQKNNGWEE